MNEEIKPLKIKCKCRKPETNLFNKIKKNFNIDYDKSFMVGDQKTDMLFAKKIKIKGLLFKDGSLYKFIKEKLK